MKKMLLRTLALMLCAMTLVLCVCPALADASICKKDCATYARKISKSYTVASSWPFYAKDNFTLYLDTNGSIIGYNVNQTKRDCPPMVKLTNQGIKVNYATSDYLLISSTWTLSIGWNKLGVNLATTTIHYKVTKDGRIIKLR